MRMLTDSMEFFTYVPCNDVLREREPNEAFCLSNPAGEIALYFPGAGEVQLDAQPGRYVARWLQIRAANWSEPFEVELPGRIRTPVNDQMALLLKPR